MLSPIPAAVTMPYADVAQVSYYDATSTGIPGSDPYGDALSYWNEIIELTIRDFGNQIVQTSSGFDMKLRLFAPTLPSNKTITKNATDFIKELPDSEQTHLAMALLMRIDDFILSNDMYRELIPFAQIAATKLDDGTLLLEWIYQYGRVNFFIDKNASESSVVFLDGSYGTEVPLVYEASFDRSSISNLARQSSDFVARFA